MGDEITHLNPNINIYIDGLVQDCSSSSALAII